jgi:autotransporter-associated beta strand protein
MTPTNSKPKTQTTKPSIVKTHSFISARLPGGSQRLPSTMKTVVLTVYLAGLFALPASAQITRNWTGAVNQYWSNPNNWNPTGTPGASDILQFGFVSDSHRTMVNDIANLTVYQLVFQANDYTLNGNMLNFLNYNDDTGIYGGSGENSSFTVTINCPLIFPIGGTIGAITGPGIFTQSTEQLFLNGPIETDALLTFSASSNAKFGGSGGGGNGRIYAASQITGSGAVFANAVNIYDAQTPTDSPGQIEFNGTPGNTFAGPLYIYTGYHAQVTFAKSSGEAAPNGIHIYQNDSVNLVIGGSGNQTGENSSIEIESGSSLSLSGNNVTVGTVIFDGSATLDTGGTLLGLNGGIIATNNSGSSAHPLISGRINLNGFEPFNVTGSTTPGLEIAASIAGNGFQKLGNNVLTLSGNNTFSGDCEISAGTVQPMTPTAFGQAGPTYGVELDGGKLQMQSLGITNEPLFVTSSNSVFEPLNQCVWTGPITLNQNLNLLAIDLASSGLATTLSGPITGSGGIRVMPTAPFSSGTVNFTGATDNTFTGTLTVDNPLTQFGKTGGHLAFGGPLVVGDPTTFNTTVARWLGAYQHVQATLTLYSGGTVNLNNFNEDFGAVTFNGGTVNTGSGQFAIYQTLTVNPANTTATINGNLGLPPGNPAVLNVGDGAADPDLLVNAIVFGTAPYFVKQGSGTLALTGVNTFTGTTLHEGGILDINNGSALSTGSIVIFGGAAATLRCSGSGTLNQGLELYGDGMGGTHGAIEVNPGVNFTFNGNQLLDAETTYNVGFSGTLQLGGILSGTGPLMKTGAGHLVFFGNNNNTYSGKTMIEEGTANLAKSSGTKAVPGNLVIGTRTSSDNTGGTTATVIDDANYNIGGTDVTIDGGSLLDLNGYYEQIVSVNLIDGGSISTSSGSLGLDGSSASAVVAVNPGLNGSSFIAGNLNFYNAGNCTFAVSNRTSTNFFPTPELDLQAVVTEPYSGTLVKSGTGGMSLDVANTINSAMTVNDGSLILRNTGSLGNAVSTVSIQGNGALVLQGGGVKIANRTLTLNSSNSLGSLRTLNGSNTWVSAVTLGQLATVSVAAGGYLQLASAIAGTGGLNQTGPGTMQLHGTAANTYSGVTTVTAGTIEASHTGSVSIPGDMVIGNDTTTNVTATLRDTGGQQLNSLANVTIHKSGFLDLTPSSGAPRIIQQLQTVSGYGPVNLGADTALTISNEVAFSFNGAINGTGSFQKVGTATMTTWGDINNTGFVELYGGDWKLNGARHNGGIIVGGNVSTARLRGDGSVDQNVDVSGNAYLAVDSHVSDHQGGVFHMGTLTSIGGIVQLDIFGPSASGGYDQLVTGGGDFGLINSTLQTSFGYPPHDGDVIKLISVTNGTLSGAFDNYPQGVMTLVGKTPVLPNYAGGDGNDFTLTVTNLALAYVGYQLAEGNGNQTVEPNECNLLYVNLANRRAVPVTITNAFLRALNANGVLVTIPSSAFPTVAAGQTMTNATPFQFRTDTNLPCGGAVGFELVLDVVNEGEFAINFNPVSGNDCSHPTGPCDSCNVVAGAFTTNTPATALPLYFVGAPSICYPPKSYPGTNPAPLIVATPYLTHSFTNATTNLLGVTALLNFNCPAAPTNALGVAAYLGQFNASNPANGYLGDIGQGGPPYPAFSFQVPPGTNFTIVVMAQTNLLCDSYSLELFGLPCPPPVLAIQPEATPAKVRVHWSSAYPGYTAQQSGRLVGAAFTNVIQSPVILNSRYSLTNLPALTNQFYRLKK